VGGAADDEARARCVVAQRARPAERPHRVLSAACLPPSAGRQLARRRQAGRLARALASRGLDRELIARVLSERSGPRPADAEC
jgi:hypothetical protein